MNSPASPQNERRRHERYQLLSGLAHGPVAVMSVPGWAVNTPLLNWSYGGTQMAASSGVTNLSPGTEIAGTLHLSLASRLAQDLRFHVVATTENTISCSFIHDNPDALLFMRPWMECLRRGAALTELAKGAVKPELWTAGWRVWRGDGPLTLSVRNMDSTEPDWRIVFQVGEEYAEVGSMIGKTFTRRSLDNDGFNSPRMQSSDEREASLLNTAVMLLAGASSGAVPAILRVKLVDQLRAGT